MAHFQNETGKVICVVECRASCDCCSLENRMLDSTRTREVFGKVEQKAGHQMPDNINIENHTRQNDSPCLDCALI